MRFSMVGSISFIVKYSKQTSIHTFLMLPAHLIPNAARYIHTLRHTHTHTDTHTQTRTHTQSQDSTCFLILYLFIYLILYICMHVIFYTYIKNITQFCSFILHVSVCTSHKQYYYIGGCQRYPLVAHGVFQASVGTCTSPSRPA